MLAAATKASFLIAIAENDDKTRPNDKVVLKETFEKANRPAEIEVSRPQHRGSDRPDDRTDPIDDLSGENTGDDRGSERPRRIH